MLTLLEHQIRSRLFATLLLFAVVIVALVWANSLWSHFYFELWHTHLSIEIGSFELSKTLHHRINDGLMSVFFFLIGLEIRKELIHGDLNDPKSALVPILAACGGMIIPTLLYVAINWDSHSVNTWGIPMATDIAFALGTITFIRKRIVPSLIIFLSVFAIVDDIGTVAVIAIVYTPDIVLLALLIAGGFLLVMYGAGRFGVRSTWFYFIIGLFGVWTAINLSGIHATLAGVLAAFTIPSKPRMTSGNFLTKMGLLRKEFDKADKLPESQLLSDDQVEVIEEMKMVTKRAEAPLQRMEEYLDPVVSIFVLPLFALANAGVSLGKLSLESLTHPVFLGVFVGLFAGKLLGIFGITRLATGIGWGKKPEGASWSQVAGIAWLGGIGFTMSLFIAELALTDEAEVNAAKPGILVASFLSALAGIALANSKKKREKSKRVTSP